MHLKQTTLLHIEKGQFDGADGSALKQPPFLGRGGMVHNKKKKRSPAFFFKKSKIIPASPGRVVSVRATFTSVFRSHLQVQEQPSEDERYNTMAFPSDLSNNQSSGLSMYH